MDSLENNFFSLLWRSLKKKKVLLKFCTKTVKKLLTEQLLVIKSGNFLCSNFSQRIHFSLREQTLHLSVPQPPYPLSILGFLINRRLPNLCLALPITSEDQQNPVLAYVSEEQCDHLLSFLPNPWGGVFS